MAIRNCEGEVVKAGEAHYRDINLIELKAAERERLHWQNTMDIRRYSYKQTQGMYGCLPMDQMYHGKGRKV